MRELVVFEVTHHAPGGIQRSQDARNAGVAWYMGTPIASPRVSEGASRPHSFASTPGWSAGGTCRMLSHALMKS